MAFPLAQTQTLFLDLSQTQTKLELLIFRLVTNSNQARVFDFLDEPNLNMYYLTKLSSITALHESIYVGILCRLGLKFELAPLYVMLGMVAVGVTIGIHTMKQQLMHSPTVRVNKKRRASLPEVEDPEVIINNSDKFLQKSFLRKVAHIQDSKPVLPDPTRPNPYTRSVCFLHITPRYTFFFLWKTLKLLSILLYNSYKFRIEILINMIDVISTIYIK